jgi:hypothetical protein
MTWLSAFSQSQPVFPHCDPIHTVIGAHLVWPGKPESCTEPKMEMATPSRAQYLPPVLSMLTDLLSERL